MSFTPTNALASLYINGGNYTPYGYGPSAFPAAGRAPRNVGAAAPYVNINPGFQADPLLYGMSGAPIGLAPGDVGPALYMPQPVAAPQQPAQRTAPMPRPAPRQPQGRGADDLNALVLAALGGQPAQQGDAADANIRRFMGY